MLKSILLVELEELNLVVDEECQRLSEELADGCGALIGCGGCKDNGKTH